jgi:hypothetical protein
MATALPDTDRVAACLLDLQAAVQSIANFKGRTALVFDEEEAVEKLKAISNLPAAVIMYEGMRSQNIGGATGDSGSSVVLGGTIMVLNDGEQLVATDTKIPTIKLLTAIRDVMLFRKSPSGHKWKFVLEAAATWDGDTSFWVQRWQVALQFQPRS